MHGVSRAYDAAENLAASDTKSNQAFGIWLPVAQM